MEKHKNLSMKGNKEVPFSGHFVNVMLNSLNFVLDEEVDKTLIIQLALLHDSIEDAGATHKELQELFGEIVADGVLALSRDENLPYNEQIADCVKRIKIQHKEVAIVKMADRLFNIRSRTESWDKLRQEAYKKEAQMICDELGYASENLRKALQEAINIY